MNAKVSFIHQIGKYRIGNPANTCLNRGFIFNKIRDLFADVFCNISGCFLLEFDKIGIILHKGMDITYMEKTVA